jgi:hypothetical protein
MAAKPVVAARAASRARSEGCASVWVAGCGVVRGVVGGGGWRRAVQRPGEGGDEHVEQRRGDGRAHEPIPPEQHEAPEAAAEGRAEGVDRVERREGPPGPLRVAHDVAGEGGQRGAHEARGAQEEHEAQGVTEPPRRGRGEAEEQRRELRQGEAHREGPEARGELQEAVPTQRRGVAVGAGPTPPGAEHEAREEGRDDEADGDGAVAHPVPELAHPDDLEDQTARAGQDEERRDAASMGPRREGHQGSRIPMKL